jgi:hypothetical protein
LAKLNEPPNWSRLSMSQRVGGTNSITARGYYVYHNGYVNAEWQGDAEVTVSDALVQITLQICGTLKKAQAGVVECESERSRQFTILGWRPGPVATRGR